MQSAQTRLSVLKQKSEHDQNYEFNRLYRNFFNPDFYMRAYQSLQSKQGNHSPGVDNQTIDGFSQKTIQTLITQLKAECYHPKPNRRKHIPKKRNKTQTRPLGIPCFNDKVVQEIIREILEVIYEPFFCETSHGFRPNHSCQTALYQIKTKCCATTWVVEGDIAKFFDTIDHDMLLTLLAKKINDGRFLGLIERFLKAGYFEFHVMHNSLSGTPQGSGVSPILANIYLHELGKYCAELSKQYTQGKARKRNPQYQTLFAKRRWALKNNKKEKA